MSFECLQLDTPSFAFGANAWIVESPRSGGRCLGLDNLRFPCVSGDPLDLGLGHNMLEASRPHQHSIHARSPSGSPTTSGNDVLDVGWNRDQSAILRAYYPWKETSNYKHGTKRCAEHAADGRMVSQEGSCAA
jgi:hypothetical protein